MIFQDISDRLCACWRDACSGVLLHLWVGNPLVLAASIRRPSDTDIERLRRELA